MAVACAHDHLAGAGVVIVLLTLLLGFVSRGRYSTIESKAHYDDDVTGEVVVVTLPGVRPQLSTTDAPVLQYHPPAADHVDEQGVAAMDALVDQVLSSSLGADDQNSYPQVPLSVARRQDNLLPRVGPDGKQYHLLDRCKIVPRSGSGGKRSKKWASEGTVVEGGLLCEPCSTDHKNGEYDPQMCVDGCICPFPRCFVLNGNASLDDPSRACVVNPFDARPAGEVTPEFLDIDLTCVQSSSNRDPLPIRSVSNEVGNSTAEQFAEFKRLTSWMFPSWWDMNLSCAPASGGTTGITSGSYRSYHDEQGDYVIENGCLSAMGGLSGFEPSVERYDGYNDAYFFKQESARDFFRQVEPLPARPDCFLDVDLLLMTTSVHIKNNGHAMNRALSAILIDKWNRRPGGHFDRTPPVTSKDGRSRRAGSGTNVSQLTGKPVDRPTVLAHIATSDYEFAEQNAFRYFHPVTTDRWISTLGFSMGDAELRQLQESHPGMRRLRASFDDVVTAEMMKASRMCFRKALVVFSCMKQRCHKRFALANEPRLRYQIGYIKTRSEMDMVAQAVFRRRLAKCLGYRLNKSPPPVMPSLGNATAVRTLAVRANQQRPLVLFHYRTKTRTIDDLGATLEPIVRKFLRSGAALFVMTEHVRLTPNEVIDMHLNADVIVGQLGAALSWAYIMPPGAALLELAGTDYGCPVERKQNGDGIMSHVDCEFAGWSVAARGRPITVFFQRKSVVKKSIMGKSVSSAHWEHLIDQTLCVLRWNQSAVGGDHGSAAAAEANYGSPLVYIPWLSPEVSKDPVFQQASPPRNTSMQLFPKWGLKQATLFGGLLASCTQKRFREAPPPV